MVEKPKSKLRGLLLGGLLPVVAYAIVEGVYGTVAGLIAGIVLGIGEMIFEYWSQGRVQWITIASNALVIILGGVSLFESNPAFFKLQPAIVVFAFALFMIGTSVMKRPLLLELMKKQGQNVPPEFEARISGMNFRLGLALIFAALVGVHAAFYWSTAAWAAYKAIGAPLIIVFYMIVETVVAKRRRR